VGVIVVGLCSGELGLVQAVHLSLDQERSSFTAAGQRLKTPATSSSLLCENMILLFHHSDL